MRPRCPSALCYQDPADPAGPRALGAAYASDLYSLWVDVNVSSVAAAAAAAPPSRRRLGSNAVYDLWVDVNTTGPLAPLPAGPPPGGFAITLYVADTSTPAGGAPPAYPGPSLVLLVEDAVTRNELAADTAVRRYVPPPAYGGGATPLSADWNAAGAWGLEAGLLMRVQPVTASVRLRVYCIAGCYASVSAVFFDAL